MKKMSIDKMQELQAGYCDVILETITGSCTNTGCIIAGVYNTVAPTAGLPTMGCYK